MPRAHSEARRQAMAVRKAASGVGGSASTIGSHKGNLGVGFALSQADSRGEGTGAKHGAGRKRMATIHTNSGHFRDPRNAIAKAINDALDPTQASGKVRVLSDEEKRAYTAELLAKRKP